MAVAIVHSSLDLTPQISNVISKGLVIATVLSVLWPVALLVLTLMDVWVANQESVRPAIPAIKMVAKVVFVVVGALMIMDSLNISITPILATLGVGSLAVGLALQDTLANFFAGLYVMVDRPVRLGDYIKLDSGEEGYVINIGWRSTRIKNIYNNMIIIPNQKITQSTITNFHMPDKSLGIRIKVGVSYKEDPAKVEAVILDVVNKAQSEVEGLLPEPKPDVKLAEFGESTLDFVLRCYVREFKDSLEVDEELRKRIFERFKQENIDMPFPTRTIHIKDSKS